MDGATDAAFSAHLLRSDGQEDLCFAMWRPSTGFTRTTALVQNPLLPIARERQVHGNASFNSEYVLRAAREAGQAGKGLAFAHSHPAGSGWQVLNSGDALAESRIANVARELTGLPLIGLTLAGDGAWSARFWSGKGRAVRPVGCESVRVVGDGLRITFDDSLLPVPGIAATQIRTVHTWGERTQGMVARLNVAVAGAGSVGMAIVDALARTGIQRLGVFDFDTVELVNIDRLRGASAFDAYVLRPKTHVARRLLEEGSTAAEPSHELHELSVCEPDGLRRLLDFDLVFSCVDRPWPRHVLNTIAFADLIPIVEGGLSAFQNPDRSLRNGYWSSTVVRPGRPCLVCLGQYDPALVQVERDGSLDDPSYIENLPADAPVRRRENVAALSAMVTAALLQQFVAFVARPSSFGDPGPLRFSLRDHTIERIATTCDPECPYAASGGVGDARLDPSARHLRAEEARKHRAHPPFRARIVRALDDVVRGLQRFIGRLAS